MEYLFQIILLQIYIIEYQLSSNGLLRIAKTLANLLLDSLQTLLHLFPQAFREILVVFKEGVAGLGGNYQTRRHGQAGLRHFTESGAFTAEKRFVVAWAFLEKVDPLCCLWLS